MASDIDRWVDRFQRLRVDRARGFAAPHKPLLLLAILDLIDDATIVVPQVELTPDLVETFHAYWQAVVSSQTKGAMYLPFFHLKSDRFWTLIPNEGHEAELKYMNKARSYAQLRSAVSHAELDNDLWEVLQTADGRQKLRQALIAAYFDPKERQELARTEAELRAVSQYRQKLLVRQPKAFRLTNEEAPPERPAIRDAAFRSAIQRLYDHTCAFCGFRVITPTGATALEAAHVVPFAVSRNDDPRNGLGLCRIHHWAFDEGLLGCEASESPKIVCSSVLDARRPTEDRLCELDGKPLLLPREKQHRPAVAALRWHLNHRLQK